MSDDVIATPFGKFLIPKGDLIGETLRAGTVWDGPGFLQVIAKEHARFGEVGTTILDVGANLGAFTVWCASQGAWRVVAVEPVPETMRYLKATLDLNKATCAETVIPLEVAAYDRAVSMMIDVASAGNSGGTVLRHASVGTITGGPLDSYADLFGQRVSLIKIDAQGCDGRAIRGLMNTIQRDHPAIVYEWEDDIAVATPTKTEIVTELLYLRYRVIAWPGQPNNYLAVWRP